MYIVKVGVDEINTRPIALIWEEGVPWIANSEAKKETDKISSIHLRGFDFLPKFAPESQLSAGKEIVNVR